MRYIPLLIALASPAYAQGPNCAPLEQHLTNLRDNFGETVRVDALMGNGAVMVITASPSGSWSAIIVSPDRIGCMVAAGEAFAAHDAEAQGTDS